MRSTFSPSGALRRNELHREHDEIAGVLAGVALGEVPHGFGVEIAAIGDAQFASDALAATQRLADLKMGEAAPAQIIDVMDPPILAFAARLRHAGPIDKVKATTRPAHHGAAQALGGEQSIHDRRQIVARMM